MKDDFLAIIQKEFPISENPFYDIGKKLNVSEEKAFLLYKELKDKKIIRQTSAIFDTKSLGYSSSLVAFRIENNIEEAAKIVNQHPGVSHNYKRDNYYNLWFTIAIPRTENYL